jgi:hypothetical protein
MIELQRFELVGFVQEHWIASMEKVQSSMEKIQDSTADAALTLALAEWIENLSWLQLGVELNVYLVETRDTLFREALKLLRSAFTQERRQKLDQFVAAGILQWALTVLNNGIIDQPLDIFSKSAENLSPYFRAGLALAKLGSDDHVAIAFQEKLLFAPDNLWQGDLKGPLSLDVITSLVADRNFNDLSWTKTNEPVAEHLVAGCIRTLDIMKLWDHLFQSIAEDHGLDEGEGAKIVRRMGQSTGWRLNLHSELVKIRFQRIANLVPAVINDLARVSKLPVEIDQAAYAKDLKNLMDDWARKHPLVLILSQRQGR